MIFIYDEKIIRFWRNLMPDLLDPSEIMFTPFEPKTKNRFIMFIEGIPAYLIKTMNRPQLQFDEIVLDHINVKRYVKGKATWSTLEITLYDPIVPSGAQAVNEWIRLHHESVTGRDGYSDFYKKDVTINVLGPVGDVVSEWILKGSFIKDATFKGFNWDTEAEAQDGRGPGEGGGGWRPRRCGPGFASEASSCKLATS